ncbi:MAG: hypothetical protein GY733_03085, partial [bacterium]|nr:hypothetical protein [bacterium]
MEGDAKPTTASDPGDFETDLRRVTCGLGFAALGFVTLLSLYLAAAPVFTNDFWFHLKMGEVYASEGLWPEADPMLHTAHEQAPVQHEWLFAVAIHGIERVSGFGGIRVFHALAVLAILAIAWSLAWRTSGDPLVAAVVTTLFAVLSWTRLFQLRPDLVSIPATLAIIGWFTLERRVPSRRTWLVFGGLILVWANLHSLFAVVLMLLLAALLGVLVQAVWERRLLDGAAREDALRRHRSVAVALVFAIGLAICLSLIN